MILTKQFEKIEICYTEKEITLRFLLGDEAQTESRSFVRFCQETVVHRFSAKTIGSGFNFETDTFYIELEQAIQSSDLESILDFLIKQNLITSLDKATFLKLLAATEQFMQALNKIAQFAQQFDKQAESNVDSQSFAKDAALLHNRIETAYLAFNETALKTPAVFDRFRHACYRAIYGAEDSSLKNYWGWRLVVRNIDLAIQSLFLFFNTPSPQRFAFFPQPEWMEGLDQSLQNMAIVAKL